MDYKSSLCFKSLGIVEDDEVEDLSKQLRLSCKDTCTVTLASLLIKRHGNELTVIL